MRVLVLRPEPGAGETAAKARALGLEPVVAPLFAVEPLLPEAPEGPFDAALLTSANAARLGGDAMKAYLGLPCYAVGESTALAAREAGFGDVRTGPSDGAALAAMARAEGMRRLLHPCGRDHIPLEGVTSVPVYAAEPIGALPQDAEEMLILLHSPRAAARLAELAGERRGQIDLAAISAQTAAAAGEGWRSIAIAEAPRDHALLELAAKLCQKARQ